jgi:hypothetical protein
MLLLASVTVSARSRPATSSSVPIVAAVLGVRHLLQAVFMGPRPTRRQLKLGALVDAAHAATMIGLALGRRGPGRLPLASATTATLFAISECPRSSAGA